MPAEILLALAALFAAGAGMMALGHRIRGTPAPARRADWIKFGVFALFVAALLLAARAGRPVAAGLLLAVCVAGAVELRRAAPPRHRHAAAALGFAALAAGLGHLLLGEGPSWPSSFALALVVVAATDAFSQLWGGLLGRRHLCPRLSPGKTVEGLVGGLASAAAVASCMGFLEPGAPPVRLAVLGLATAAGAVAGDLAFSAVKRRAGLKDFSAAIPGHGGVLDRFDSLVLAAPVFHWTRLALLT